MRLSIVCGLLLAAVTAAIGCETGTQSGDDLAAPICSPDPARPSCDSVQPGNVYPVGACQAGQACRDYSVVGGQCRKYYGHCECVSGQWRCALEGPPRPRDMALPISD